MNSARYLCKCNYCGLEWTHISYEWRYTPAPCKVCGESVKIDFKKLPEEGRDVFGYRFSPPFPPKFW